MWGKRRTKIKTVDLGLSVRGLLLDAGIPNVNFFDEKLGIHAASDDVLEREYEDSELRINAISPILPLVYTYCSLLKDAATDSVMDDLAVPEEQREQVALVINKFAMSVSLAATTGVLSQLNNLDLISINVKGFK
jgi:hypothetical protein